jgi:hypothetical protein
VKALAVELGLEPAFVRKALELVAPQHKQKTSARARRKEFRALLAGLGLPMAWGAIAYSVMEMRLREPGFSAAGP